MKRPRSVSAQRQNHDKQLSERLEKRLAGYALAAGATGVAALSLAPAAQADIIYTPANIPIPFINYNYTLTPIYLNADGIADLSFGASVYRSGRINAWSLNVSAGPGNGVMTGPLGGGYWIGAGGKFDARDLMADDFQMASYGGGQSHHAGPWFTRGTEKGFLGVEFPIDGQTHFGWVGFTAGYESGTVTGYAYESIAGQSIEAGETDASPEPGTLSLLALGSLGLGFWRRRKAASRPQQALK